MQSSRFYRTKCSGCLQFIPSDELVMRALGNIYHLRCFMCVMCGHCLQKGEQFVMKDGHIYCRLDFEKEYAQAVLHMNVANDWCPSPFSAKCMYSIVICYLQLLSSFVHKVKVLGLSKFYVYVHTCDRGSSPGVVWCINKVVLLLLVHIYAFYNRIKTGCCANYLYSVTAVYDHLTSTVTSLLRSPH